MVAAIAVAAVAAVVVVVVVVVDSATASLWQFGSRPAGLGEELAVDVGEAVDFRSQHWH